jgi:hypothetical protein
VNEKQSNAPRTWGVSSAEFYANLRDAPIQAVTLDGKLYKGTLVGVDLYDLVIKQTSGATILLAKHAVKFLQADAPDKPGA